MQVQVHYQGLEASPWLDQFMTKRLEKIERYVGPTAHVQIHLKRDANNYSTTLAVHGLFRDYAFSADGDNLYESFSLTVDKAVRALGEQKKKLKDKIHRKVFLRGDLAY